MKHQIITFSTITVAALSGIIFWETGIVWIVILVIALIYLLITAYGSSQIQTNYFIKSINRGKGKGVSFTFDDGPDPDTTPKILDILREKDIKAAFFLIGRRAEKYPDLVRRIDEEGHIIGNHSFSHNYLIGFFSKARLKKDLMRCNAVIDQITGKSPAYFRPPFGVTNPRYKTVLSDLQLQSIGWSLRSLDTRAKNKYELIDKILTQLRKRDIILLHDTQPVTVESLPDIIEHCIQKGIHIEPLSKLINKEPYGQV